MPLPSGDVQIIQQGASANLVVYDDNNNAETIALVTSASYNEDFKVVEAIVLGFYGAVSQDSQGYTCSITIGRYVPFDKDATEPYLDGGTTTLDSKIKTRAQIGRTRKGTFFPQLDIVDTTKGQVYNSFKSATVSTNGSQVNPGSYVSANLQLMCIERLI